MKTSHNGLKPISEKQMPEWLALRLKPTVAPPEKSALELRRRGLPMIIWKDGKVREVPA